MTKIAVPKLQSPLLFSIMQRMASGDFGDRGEITLCRDTLIRLYREWEGGDGRKHLRPREILERSRKGQIQIHGHCVRANDDD